MKFIEIIKFILEFIKAHKISPQFLNKETIVQNSFHFVEANITI